MKSVANRRRKKLAERLSMPLEKVRKVMKIAKEPISLETPIGDEEDSHLGDFIEDKALHYSKSMPLFKGQFERNGHPCLGQPDPREERVCGCALVSG